MATLSYRLNDAPPQNHVGANGFELASKSKQKCIEDGYKSAMQKISKKNVII